MPKRKKKRNYNTLKLVCTVTALAALVIFLLRWNYSRRVKFAHYDAFGIDMPVAYNIHGIDVSKYQKKIDWKEVKAMNIDGIDLDFVFIKATEGLTLTDNNFKQNWRGAKNQQLVRGAYHYFIPSQDAVAQASYFISRVRLLPGDLPPVLDVEQAGAIPGEIFRTKIKTWLKLVEMHYKAKPIIYTNAGFYEKYLGGEFDEYPLWIAHYYERKKPRIQRSWAFWQHNDTGNVNGIDTKVDFNVFNGDSVAFSALLIK